MVDGKPRDFNHRDAEGTEKIFTEENEGNKDGKGRKRLKRAEGHEQSEEIIFERVAEVT
jgi:hypothetical protein